MAAYRITEISAPASVLSSASFLMTQLEEVDGSPVETIVRPTLQQVLSALSLDSTNGGGGLDSAAKAALADFFSKMAQMIPKLAFTDASHNGAATAAAASAAASALSGSGSGSGGNDTPAVTAYTVTNTLSNCTNSNAAASVNENAGYSGTLTASSGYTLQSVTVTMGGTDITSAAYNSGTGAISIASVTGNIVITASAAANQASATTYTVTNTLSNCTNSNAAASVNENAGYSGTITASSGYTLQSVTVTMGGTDITSAAYNSGTGAISIASVTGNIVITASAAANQASATTYTVTNTLSNCTNSNAAASVNENAGYSGTLTASSGYTLQSVTVTMGGTDITSTAYNSGTGAISIASVTGNIVITASAAAAQAPSLTLHNLVPNGNFASTDGWTRYGHHVLTVSNNTAAITDDGTPGTKPYIVTGNLSGISAGQQLLMSIEIASSTADINNAFLGLYRSGYASSPMVKTQKSGVGSFTADTWYRISAIVTVPDELTESETVWARIQAQFSSAITGQTLYARKAMVIDVTDFDSSGLQTAEQMMDYIDTYCNGFVDTGV